MVGALLTVTFIMISLVVATVSIPTEGPAPQRSQRRITFL